MIWNLFVIWCLGFGIFFWMSRPEMDFVLVSSIATIDEMAPFVGIVSMKK